MFKKEIMKPLIFIITSLIITECSSEPNDAAMENHFKNNKDIFVEMVNSKSDCVSNTKPGPKCLELMKKTKIIFINKEQTISGAIALDYNAFTSNNKGYLYSPLNKPCPLYTNLNQRPNDLGSYQKGYKKIEDKWFIYYEHLN